MGGGEGGRSEVGVEWMREEWRGERVWEEWRGVGGVKG